MSPNPVKCGEPMVGNQYCLGNDLVDSGNPQVERARELGWLAGIIDGEGCITLARAQKKHHENTPWFLPLIHISNTDPYIISEIVRIMRKYELPFWLQHRRTGKYANKNLYLVMIDGMKRVKKLLDVVIPYLIGKKEEAVTVREFIQYRSDKHGGNGTNSPYGEAEVAFFEKCKHIKRTIHLRDLILDEPVQGSKIKSELHRDMQTVAEMTTGVANSNC